MATEAEPPSKRVLRKHSQVKSQEPENMDITDDSLSTTGAGSVADDSSMSETPTQSGRRPRSKHLSHNSTTSAAAKHGYKCTNILKEDHGGPIFCIQFHPRIAPGQPLVFATVGSNRASVYQCPDCLVPPSSLTSSNSQQSNSRKRPSDSISTSKDSAAVNEGINDKENITNHSTVNGSEKSDSTTIPSNTSETDKDATANDAIDGTAKSNNAPAAVHSSESCEAGSSSMPARTGEIRLLQSYIDADSDENLYSCTWTTDSTNSHPLLAIAGSRGIVRIIDVTTGQCYRNLVGHGQAVNDLKIHPHDSNILLSVSKDHSLRLWNIVTGLCVAIFAGVDGHRDEVLSADIDIDGRHLVSCGMDHSVRIWRLDKPALETALALSYTHDSNKPSEKPFATFSQHYPDFSTRDIHSNYVDCVVWYGRFILSKSCENEVICWKPGRLNDPDIGTPVKSNLSSGPSSAAASQQTAANSSSDSQNFTILHKFEIRDCDIWFLRFCLDYWRRWLAVGNQAGRVYIWDLDSDDWNHSKPTILSHPKCTTAIRQTCFSVDASVLLCVCDDSTIWRWDRL